MKKAKWLCALVLAFCLALGVGTLTMASADGGPVIGTTLNISRGTATINGTQTRDKTIITSTATDTQVNLTATNYNRETITVKLQADYSAWISLQLYCNAGEVNIGTVGVSSVVDTPHELTIDATSLDKLVENDSITLYINVNGPGTLTISEISIGDATYQHPAYVDPEPTPEPSETVLKDYTDWTTKSSNVTVSANNVDATLTQEGVDEGIATITFSDTVGEDYTDSITGETTTSEITYVAIPFTEDVYLPSWSNLYIKYKATSGISYVEASINGVVVANNTGSADLAKEKEALICGDVLGGAWNSAAYGYNDEYMLAISQVGSYVNTIKEAKTALYLTIFFNSDAVAENEKLELAGIAFGSTRPEFATDDPENTAVVGKQINPSAARFTISKDGTNTLISQAEGVEATQYAIVNIHNYTKTDADRFVKIEISSDKDFVMAAYYQWAAVLSPYTTYKANTVHTIYADTKIATALTEGNIELWLFLDANGGDNTAKTYTIKSITFTDTAYEAAPEASALTINYKAETVSFDAEKVNVFSDEGNTAIENNATVTPGTKLYMRTPARDDSAYRASALVEFSVPARPEAEDITASASETAISITKEGYSFKLGDGEWTTTGAFTGLTAGTEYTITYKKDATDSSFASAEKTIKVTTAAATGGDDNTSTEPAPKKGCKNSVTGVSVGAAVVLMLGASLLLVRRKRKN